jgi:K+-transporting ATPase KdpF subunit
LPLSIALSEECALPQGALSTNRKEEGEMNSPLEYILVGIVTLGVLIYLVIALLAPEKF